jgi:hypothetical protein
MKERCPHTEEMEKDASNKKKAELLNYVDFKFPFFGNCTF